MTQESDIQDLSDDIYANIGYKKCDGLLPLHQEAALGGDSIREVESSGQFFSSSSNSLVSVSEHFKKTDEKNEKEKSSLFEESLDHFSSCDEYYEEEVAQIEPSHKYENGSFEVQKLDDQPANSKIDMEETSINQGEPETNEKHTPLPRSHSYDDIETMGIVRYSKEPTSEGSRPGSALSSGTVYENVGPLYENMTHHPSDPFVGHTDPADQKINRFNVERNSELSPKVDYFRKLKQEKRQKVDKSLSIDETSTFAIDQDCETSTCNELSHSFEAEEDISIPIVLEKSPPPVRRREKPVRHSSLLQNFFKRRKSSLELEGNAKHNSLPPGMQGVMMKMGDSSVGGVSEDTRETVEDGLEIQGSVSDDKTSSPHDLPSESLDEEFHSKNIYENVGIAGFSSAEVFVEHPTSPGMPDVGVTEPVSIEKKHLCFDTLKKRPLTPFSSSQSNQPYILPSSFKVTPVTNASRKTGSMRSVYNTLRGPTKVRRRTRKSSVALSTSPEFDSLSRAGSRRQLYSPSPSYLSLPRRNVIKPDTFTSDPSQSVSNDNRHGNRIRPNPVEEGWSESNDFLSGSENKSIKHQQARSKSLGSDHWSASNSPSDAADSVLNLQKTKKKRGLSLTSLFRIGRRSSFAPSLKLRTNSPSKNTHMTF